MQKTCLERTLSEKRAAYGKKLFLTVGNFEARTFGTKPIYKFL